MRYLTAVVEDDVFRKVKVQIAIEGINLKEYITSLVLKDMEEKGQIEKLAKK